MNRRIRNREDHELYLRELRHSREVIKTDFHLFLHLLFEIFVFVVLLIPRLLAGIFYMFFNKHKSRYYFNKIIHFPTDVVGKVWEWFFQAKITSFLIILLFVMFIIQNIFINTNVTLLHSLMTHTAHLFEGNFHSIFTSIFLHANIVHLLTNCLALLIFGRLVEKQFRSNMFWVFIASGVIANVISNTLAYLQGDLFYSLGASGAIAGLIIFAVLLEPFALSSVFVLPIPIFIIGWFLILIDIIGLTNPSQVNHMAHIGGYSALLFLFFFLSLRNRQKIIGGFIVNLLIIIFLFMLSRIVDLNLIRELVWI